MSMKNLTLANIAGVLNGQIKNSEGYDISREVTCVEIDSRKIQPGGVFIATKGEKVDGHTFVESVFEKGAVCAIVEKEGNYPIPYIVVEDSFDALKKIAGFYRQNLDIPVVGITGSVGKTSTKEFIATVLSEKFCVLKTMGNYNNEVGMPLTILSIRPEHEIAVVEMGISHFGEMERLASISRPDTCVITNIGQCHLENLIDTDGVLKEKTQMLRFMNTRGNVVLNGDDDKLGEVKAPFETKLFHYGFESGNDITPVEIEEKGFKGTRVTLEVEQNNAQALVLEANIPLPGRHMVYNAMAAVRIGLIYGMNTEEIVKGIEAMKATDGRSHVMSVGEYTVIDDCYNANPVSMKAAIDLLKSTEGRKVAILGDMFELGQREESMHEEVGRYAAENGIDVIITIGKLSSNMYKGAQTGNSPVYYFETKEEAVEELKEILKPNDTVLVKASHGMQLDAIIEWFKGLEDKE